MSESERFQSPDVLKAFQAGAEGLSKSVNIIETHYFDPESERLQLGKWSVSSRELSGRMLQSTVTRR